MASTDTTAEIQDDVAIDELQDVTPLSLTWTTQSMELTWTPDVHGQKHLRELGSEGRNAFVASLEEGFPELDRELTMQLCKAANPVMAATAPLLELLGGDAGALIQVISLDDILGGPSEEEEV